MLDTIYRILLFLITFFLELLILYILFENIYRFAAGDKSAGDDGQDHSFFYLAGKVITYLKWKFDHRERSDRLEEYPYSEEMKAFIVSHSGIHNELLRNVFLLISGIIVFAIIITIPAKISSGIPFQFFWGACGFSAFFDWWKKHRKYVIEFLAKLEIFMAEFEQQVRRDKKAKSKPEKNGAPSTKKIHLLLLVISFAVVCSIFLFKESVRLIQMINGKTEFEEFIEQENRMNSYGLTVCIIILLVCCIAFEWFRKGFIDDIKGYVNYYRNEWENRSAEKALIKHVKGVLICPELSVWEQDIRQMCKSLKIRRAIFWIDSGAGLNAEACMVGKKLPVILCRKSLLENLNERLKDMTVPAVCFLLGHEMVHIYYKDTCDFENLTGILTLSFFFHVILCIGAGRTGNPLLILIIFFSCVFWDCFPLRLWIDDRCRKQIMELRADRVGMKVSRTSPETVCALFEIFESTENKKYTNVVYHYYKTHIDVDEHMSIKRRKQEIMRGQKWGLLDYVRYMFIIQKNLILFKGWEI